MTPAQLEAKYADVNHMPFFRKQIDEIKRLWREEQRIRAQIDQLRAERRDRSRE